MATSDCIFCKIVEGEIPSTKVYEDEHAIAFQDLYPAAPVHILVIPKKHIASLDAATKEDQERLGHLLLTVQRVAREQGLDQKGYRVVNNMGDDGGQTVHHIHFHLLGGRSLTWPPG
ncbi:histidine triad nucleotide-binding protein [Risungbinella massiliensis]|uniref:histidine triad nucleotide-binding protein n=1 Tax=Risungbinella massiliensis TaxID=1329796 RepID=UPI0005CB891C|nr:histidine triad nucleotide-binding protein [Risungbinella massiliensis]